MNEIVSIISAVGFPIVAAIGCGYFVKWQYEQNQKQTEEMPRARHGEKSWNFHALSTHPTLLRSLCVHQPRSSPKTILLGF